jgi:hypothetical protein
MIKNIELYKDFYFRENERKNHLNNSVNVPILIITAIISIHFFLFSQNLTSDIVIFGKIISSLNFISIIISLYFLSKSFSNLISTHTYREVPNTGKLREYEIEVIKEQKKASSAQILFELHLVNEFSKCAAHNYIVNKNRTEDLAKSKITIFISVFLTSIFSLVYIISII